jgi:hypothetical protein
VLGVVLIIAALRNRRQEFGPATSHWWAVCWLDTSESIKRTNSGIVGGCRGLWGQDDFTAAASDYNRPTPMLCNSIVSRIDHEIVQLVVRRASTVDAGKRSAEHWDC